MTELEPTAPVPVSKVRLRFAKTGDLRFLSHHDLMRLMERLCRRAQLPLRFSAGFHPKPKIVFASALSLGIVGRREVLEIELDGPVRAEAVFASLSRLAPASLEFFSAEQLSPRQSAQPIAATYFFPLSSSQFPDLANRLAELLARQSIVIQRTRHLPGRPARPEPPGEERLDALTRAEPVPARSETKPFDLRPFLRRLWRDDAGLWMDLGISNQGAARPEEVLRQVGLEQFMLDGESVLERIDLILDEASATPPAATEHSRHSAPGAGKSLAPAAASLIHRAGLTPA